MYIMELLNSFRMERTSKGQVLIGFDNRLLNKSRCSVHHLILTIQSLSSFLNSQIEIQIIPNNMERTSPNVLACRFELNLLCECEAFSHGMNAIYPNRDS